MCPQLAPKHGVWPGTGDKIPMLKRLTISLTCLVTAATLASSAAAATAAPTARTARTAQAAKMLKLSESLTKAQLKTCRAHLPVLASLRTPSHHYLITRCATYVLRHSARKPSARAASVPSGNSWSTFSSHIDTWALDDCGEGSNTPSSLVRAWASYVETNCGPGAETKALADCHSGGANFCKVIQYLDTNWIYQQGSPPYSQFNQDASASWYQQVQGSGARVQTGSYSGGFLINQLSSGVQSFFRNYVRTNYNAVDGLMMDDQSSGLSTQLYYSSCGCKQTQDVQSSASLRSAHEAMSAAMTHSNGQQFNQIDNTLPANPYLPQGLDMLDKSGVNGLLKEGSPEYNGHLDPYYSTLLDEISYAADKTRGFVVPLSYGQAGASYQDQSRRVQEATMLLGYSPGHLVDWANLEQGSNNLSVWPEEGIYPTRPLQSMSAPGGSGCLAGSGNVCSTGGHNDIQVAPGVYRREFGACYDKGVQFGACAAIVNTTSSPVTISSSWLKNSYGHVISLTGGDVQSGGSVDLNGRSFTPGSTTVAPHDATLLAS
jgi:hypothetical protein